MCRPEAVLHCIDRPEAVLHCMDRPEAVLLQYALFRPEEFFAVLSKFIHAFTKARNEVGGQAAVGASPARCD